MNGRARFPWLPYLVAFIAIAVVALLPVVSVLGAGLIADANGCALDEGGVHPCVVAGKDWGDLLYTMGVMGWLSLVSLPLGGIALVILAVAVFIHRSIWWRAQRTTP
ncbi:MAG TPA: hypothetical protein VL418_11330 [Devosiaceae bacterium]|nr:hypothetical protein [Devosiaceae bacterium]